MDAATAAAMSDPERNRWFRRRWAEQRDAGSGIPASTPTPAPEIAVTLTGLALLAEWRRSRRCDQTDDA